MTEIASGETFGTEQSEGNLTLMNEEEARSLVEEIKEHLETARELLYELYSREGWRALGYSSWRSCVNAEFGRSESQLYRELAAARVEAKLGAPLGTFPESHIRAAREIWGDDDDAVARVIHETDLLDISTAQEIKRYAAETWVKENIGDGFVITERLRAGEISANDAYQIGITLISLNGDVPDGLPAIIQWCSDPRLARQLVVVSRHLPELWAEILATQSIPGLDENVPLDKATHRSLEAYIQLDHAEGRAMFVEANRRFYDQLREMRDRLEHLAWAVVRATAGTKELYETIEKMGMLLQDIDELRKEREDEDKDLR